MSSPHQRATLGSVAKFINGFAFKPSDWEDCGRKIIRIQNLTDPSKPYNQTRRQVDEKFIVRKGDILVSWSATLDVFEWRDDEALLNQHIFKAVPNPKVVDKDYFKIAVRESLRDMAKHTHGSTMKHVNRGDFIGAEIPLPPLATQKHIARVLEQADQLRKQAQQMESELKQLAQSLFLEMFGDPISNPKGWEIAPLEKLIAAGDKINYGVVQPGDDVEVGVPLVRVADLSENMDSLHALKRIRPEIEVQYGRSRLVGDEILIGCVGSIGRVGLAGPVLKGANIARAVARVRPSSNVSRLFLYFYLQTSFVQGYFNSETRTVSQPTLNISLIEKTPVVVPPLEKQLEFDSAMRAIQIEMKSLREKSTLLDSLFNSLMQRAFNGELTAPERKAA